MIKNPELHEIDYIVELHTKSLREGLLYKLGNQILKIFYKEILSDKRSFMLAYYNKKAITGVAASTEDANVLFEKIRKKHFFSLLFGILLKSFRNPLIPFHLVMSKHPSQIKPELLFLFIDSNYRGKKIGQKLVKATNKEFKHRKVREYKITILSSNERGKKFYENLGFEKINEYNYLGEKRDVYKYKIY